MPSQESNEGLKENYLQWLSWLQEHPNLGYWMCLLISTFTMFLLIYFVLTNLRLHRHIRQLSLDKQRLMEEKDLIRKGASKDL